MRVVVLGKGLMLANIVLGVLDSGADLVGVFRYEQTSESRIRLLFEDFFKPAPEVTLLNEQLMFIHRCYLNIVVQIHICKQFYMVRNIQVLRYI